MISEYIRNTNNKTKLSSLTLLTISYIVERPLVLCCLWGIVYWGASSWHTVIGWTDSEKHNNIHVSLKYMPTCVDTSVMHSYTCTPM